MEKPIIGVVPLVDIARESYWMLPGYMRGVEAAGGLPLMLPLTEIEGDIARFADEMDGFLFTGGQDVSPSVYGEERRLCCGEICPERDAMEAALLKAALERNKPALGICRGLQFINAALGGTLYQDLGEQHGSTLAHHQMPPYNKPAHKVTIARDTPLFELLGVKELPVNSLHHQGIKGLAPALSVMARAEDGLIEAVYMKSRAFLWAVQWHPEYAFETDRPGAKIFSAFVSACM